ncbi:MAG: hypothetical protein ACMUEM_01470 [Flavobacteriales bacterium AspAUS03]
MKKQPIHGTFHPAFEFGITLPIDQEFPLIKELDTDRFIKAMCNFYSEIRPISLV